MTLAAELTRVRASVFEPYTLRRTPAMSGAYVNVAPAGFRHGARPAEWPPTAPAVFVFGGSTAFGYGLADSETIPAAIEAALRRARPTLAVYNFASLNHTSVEARIRFEQLLLDGHIPAAAVFIDGFADLVAPFYSEAVWRRMTRATRPGWRAAVAAWRERPDSAPGKPDRTVVATIARYRANARLIAAAAQAFDVRSLFVWQPVPCVGWPGEATSRHAAGHADAGAVLDYIRDGYATMSREREPPGTDFLWLDAIQAGRDDELYLDPDHYDAAFSAEIAGHIATRLDGLLAR